MQLSQNKLYRLLPGLLLLLGACSSGPFEGRIQYQTSLTGEAAQVLEPLLRAQNPGFTLYQKGDKMRLEHQTETIIVDYARDSAYVLFPRDSSYLAFPLRGGNGDTLPGLTEEPLPEKRDIAGYTCSARKVQYTAGDRRYTLTFWEAPELQPSPEAVDKVPILPRGIRAGGMPLRLESSISDQPFTLIHEAVQVEKKALDDHLFIVPLDYKKAE